MNKLKVMSVWVFCTMLIALLAACGGSQGTQGGKATITVMTWESAETNTAIDKALQRFMKDNPDIVVQRIDTPSTNYGDKLASLILAKKLPDLFWCGNDTEQQYTSQGLLYDYAPKLKGSQGANFSGSNFVPAALTNWTAANGQMGGLPSLMNTYGIWYNADAFEKAGLTLPAQGWTWDQLFSDAQKLKSGNDYGLVADSLTANDGPFTMSEYALSAGGQPLADKINYPTKVTVDSVYTEGVSKLAAAVQNGSVAPPGYVSTNATSAFSTGKLPMLMGGQWLAANFLTDKPTIKFGFAPLPIQKNAATLYDAVGICTPGYTKNPDAAWKAMQFLDSTLWESVLTSSPVAPTAYKPASTSYFNALKSAGMDSVVSTVNYTLDTPTVSGVRFTTVWASKAADVITAYWPDILKGKKPISALQTMADQLNGLIQSNS